MPPESFSGAVALPIESEALLLAARATNARLDVGAQTMDQRNHQSALRAAKGRGDGVECFVGMHAGPPCPYGGEHGRRGMPDPSALHRCRTVDGLQTLTTACIDGPAEPDVVVFDEQFIP